MQAAYQKKVVARIRAAWPECEYVPCKVEELDGRSWSVTYAHQETGECITAPLLKRDLRTQEQHQAFGVLTSLAFPATSDPIPSSLSAKESARIHQLVRASTADYSVSPVKILGAFVDTLVLNVIPTDENFLPEKRKIEQDLQQELTILKERAQEEEKDIVTRFLFAGIPLKMTAKGKDGFQWILKNTKGTIAVNRSSKMTLLAQVRCSSEHLWEVRDLGKIVSDLHVALTAIFGQQINLQVSAVDLAVDVLNLDLTFVQEVKQHFVSRAQLKDQHPLSEQAMLDGPGAIHSRWDRLTGIPFGKRSGAVSALIYDKTHEIKYHSPEKAWFHDSWRYVAKERYGIEWTEEMTVHRVEVHLRRPALGEMKQEGVFHGIDSAYDLESHLPGLWSYAVGHVSGNEEGLPDGWLRYVVPTSDTNRTRWPVHPDWKVIQQAFQPEEQPQQEPEEDGEEQQEISSTPVIPESQALNLAPYVRERKRHVNMDRLIDQIAGCVVTVEAWRARPQLPELAKTFGFIQWRVKKRLEEKHEDFAGRVQEKQENYFIEVERREKGTAV
jgi:hypothetical protein